MLVVSIVILVAVPIVFSRSVNVACRSTQNGAYGNAGIRNPEPEPETETEPEPEPEPEPELKLRPKNWEALKPVPDTRVGIKFKMASSVIIVLRNFQHSDRDTKGILTFGK